DLIISPARACGARPARRKTRQQLRADASDGLQIGAWVEPPAGSRREGVVRDDLIISPARACGARPARRKTRQQLRADASDGLQ
ncbi:hypothetical protein CTI14_66895, partial [Methylobacterium radiotolerans]